MSKRRQILTLLDERNFEELLRRFDEDPNLLRRQITTVSYHSDAELRNKTIECFGYLAKARAQEMPEFFRETIRRHVWGMNDESGNMDWSAPQVIAQIVIAAPNLFEEFASIMIEAALNEPIFEESLKEAVAMLKEADEKFIEYHLPILKERNLL